MHHAIPSRPMPTRQCEWMDPRARDPDIVLRWKLLTDKRTAGRTLTTSTRSISLPGREMCKFEHAVHCEIVRTDSIPANIPLPGFPSWSLILPSFFQQRSGGGAADEYINLFDIYLSTCAAWRGRRDCRQRGTEERDGEEGTRGARNGRRRRIWIRSY